MVRLPTRSEDLQSLFKALRDLVPESDLDRVLEGVIETTTRILGADRALVFTYDRKSDGLVFRYGVNVDGGVVERAHEYSASIVERASKGEILMATDCREGKELSPSESIFKYDIRTVLCAPMISDGNLLGVIYADTRGKTTFLDEEKRACFLSFVDFMSDVLVKVQGLKEKDEEIAYLRRRLAEEELFPEILGRSREMQSVKEKVTRIASVDYPVSILVVGGSGTGKELIARVVHQYGHRGSEPFVVVNCAAIPATLMESELFGHERGAFTGALARRQGFFEHADGGVVFLDEIGDLPVELQPKLLRVLQFGSFSRIGGRKEISVDVQVICATSKDLYREMQEGRFRKDLFHRLAVEVIHVPPLRERKEDIMLLANHFMRYFSEKMGKRVDSIDPAAQRLIKGHDYRENNVRELKNLMERAVLSTRGRTIRKKDLVFSEELLLPGADGETSPQEGEVEEGWLVRINAGLVGRMLEEAGGKELPKGERPYYRVHEEMERQLILLALRHAGWKKKRAAELLGINVLNLRTKLTAMLEDYMEECGGEIHELARRYKIPPGFLRRKATQRNE